MGKTEEAEKRGGRRRRGYREGDEEGDGMEEKGRNELLQVERREGYREVVRERGRPRTDEGCCLTKMLEHMHPPRASKRCVLIT